MKQIVTITGENLNIVTSNVEATAATKKTKAQMRLEALKAAGETAYVVGTCETGEKGVTIC